MWKVDRAVGPADEWKNLQSDPILPPLCLNSVLWSISSGPNQCSATALLFFLFFRRQKSQARLSGKTGSTVDEFSGNLSGVFVGAVSVYSVALCLLVFIQTVGRPAIGEVQSRSRWDGDEERKDVHTHTWRNVLPFYMPNGTTMQERHKQRLRPDVDNQVEQGGAVT